MNGTPDPKERDTVLRVAIVLMGIGAILLLSGEGLEDIWIYTAGAAVTAVSLVMYYKAGLPRVKLENRYHELPKWKKALILLAMFAPWIVLYFLMASWWLALSVASGAIAASIAIAWYWKRKYCADRGQTPAV